MVDQLQSDPVIELSTDVSTRRKVKIDGELYDIINLDEMSIGERLRSERFVNQWKKLAENETDPNSNDLSKITQRIDGVIARILFAPDAIRAKLLDGHKFALLNAVFTRPGQVAQPQS